MSTLCFQHLILEQIPLRSFKCMLSPFLNIEEHLTPFNFVEYGPGYIFQYHQTCFVSVFQ